MALRVIPVVCQKQSADVALGNYSAKPLRKKVGVDGGVASHCQEMPPHLFGSSLLLNAHVKVFYILQVLPIRYKCCRSFDLFKCFFLLCAPLK